MIFSQDYQRSVEDVQTIIQYAKLDVNNLTNTAQAIYYPDTDQDMSRLKLLEADEHILQQIKEGKSVSFKGALNEKVVICTESRTYEVKEAEISNSLLLVPHLRQAQATSRSPLKSPKGGVNTSLDSSTEETEVQVVDSIDEVERKDVVKIFHDYFECRQVKPKYRKIIDLLRLTKYSGAENEHLVDRSLLFRFNQLLDTVQCSKEEFQEGLKKYRAIEIEDRIRMLDNEYEYRIVTLMLALIGENSWELDEIDKASTIESLDGIIPYEIVDGIFDVYTEKSERVPGKFKYREDLVCALFAEKILQQGLKFHIDDFLTTWQETLPEGFHADEKYLRGIGIVDREGSVPCVKGLNEADLPTNLLVRLVTLFRAKERWNLEQIQPYIENVIPPIPLLNSDATFLCLGGILATEGLAHKDLTYLCGLTKIQFDVVYSLCTHNQNEWPSYRIPLKEQLLLTLLKYRHNWEYRMLSIIFKIRPGTAQTIFIFWTRLLYSRLEAIDFWKLRSRKEGEFVAILDCTEIPIEKPAAPDLQQATFSKYKNTNTFKTLVAIDEQGVVTFVSDAYGGCVSDNRIVELSGIVDLLSEGDYILADKGFEQIDVLSAKGVVLNRPPTKRGLQLTEADVAKTRAIASRRIEVERVIGYAKTYKILSQKVKHTLFPYMNMIIKILFKLTNIRPPICKISNDKA